MRRFRGRSLIAAIIATSTVPLIGCHTRPKGVQDTAPTGTSVTVLVDLSASFAPLTANDVTALRATFAALEDKATHAWPGATQIMVRKIGTASVMNSPLCPPMVHEAKLVGSGDAGEEFRKQLSDCVDRTVKTRPIETPSGDRYTDISGAIAASVQAAESVPDRKILVLFSDLVEQEAPSVPSTTLSLHGERVILIHRPGLDDRTLGDHAERTRTWEQKLKAAGASQVTDIPEEWVTSGLISRVLDNTSVGTYAIVLLDPHTLKALSNGDGAKGRLTILADALGTLSGNWKPPVTILWHVLGPPSARITSMPALEYQPRLVERKEEINSLDTLQVDLRETAIGAMRLMSQQNEPTSDLLGAIEFTHAPDVLGGASVYLFLVSDLTNSAEDARLDRRLVNETVSLIYAPAVADRSDPNRLFNRIKAVKSMMLSAGARKVCSFELSSMVPSQLAACAKESQ